MDLVRIAALQCGKAKAARDRLPVFLMPANFSRVLPNMVVAVLLLAPTAGAQRAAAPPIKPPDGPFACTELIGLLSTGEWFDGGFYNALGEFKSRSQGRFSHYGYIYEYAKP